MDPMDRFWLEPEQTGDSVMASLEGLVSMVSVLIGALAYVVGGGAWPAVAFGVPSVGSAAVALICAGCLYKYYLKPKVDASRNWDMRLLGGLCGDKKLGLHLRFISFVAFFLTAFFTIVIGFWGGFILSHLIFGRN